MRLASQMTHYDMFTNNLWTLKIAFRPIYSTATNRLNEQTIYF
jgi:hypothetical protein